MTECFATWRYWRALRSHEGPLHADTGPLGGEVAFNGTQRHRRRPQRAVANRLSSVRIPCRVSPTGSDVKLMVQVLFTKNVVKFRTLSKIAVSWKLG